MRTVPPAMASKLMKAAELFADRGLDGTKTDDIAAVTGIPKATIYYYFDGKEQVLSFIFRTVLDAVQQAVAAGVNGPGRADERLVQVIRNHLGVFADYPEASTSLHFDLGRAARLPDIAQHSNAAFIEPVAALLAEGLDDGSFRSVGDPRLAAVAILGAVSTAAIHIIALEVCRPVGELVDVVAPLVLDGLRLEVAA